MCPKIPAIFLPWQLSNNNYFPNHVTLVIFSVLNSCLISPLVEEGFKLLFFKFLLSKTKIKNKSKLENKIDNKVKNKIVNSNNIKKEDKNIKDNNDENQNKNENKDQNKIKNEDQNKIIIQTDEIVGSSKEKENKTGKNKIEKIGIEKIGIEKNYSKNILEGRSLRSYMTVMTSVSIGIKVADNIRRILLYTNINQKHKMFFAVSRSFFPGNFLFCFIIYF